MVRVYDGQITMRSIMMRPGNGRREVILYGQSYMVYVCICWLRRYATRVRVLCILCGAGVRIVGSVQSCFVRPFDLSRALVTRRAAVAGRGTKECCCERAAAVRRGVTRRGRGPRPRVPQTAALAGTLGTHPPPPRPLAPSPSARFTFPLATRLHEAAAKHLNYVPFEMLYIFLKEFL